MIERAFPGVEQARLVLPRVNVAKNGYDNDATLAAPIDGAVNAYYDAATSVAQAATANQVWMECALADAGCLQQTVVSLAATLFRHELDAEQATILGEFVTTESAQVPANEVLRMAIQALLESPEFLYVPESGDAGASAPEGLVALTPGELANRLALFLWDEPADAALVAQVTENGIDDAALAGIVDDMLDDPKADAGFERFVSQWMPLREGAWGGSFDRDPSLSGDAQLLADVRESALRFLKHAFLEANIEELLTSRTAYVNDRIAPLFGIEAPGSEELVAVELPEGQRAGILTHPAVLATAPSDATFYSIYRGVMIMNQLLCVAPGLPQFDEINVSEGMTSGRTSRERLETEHLDETCRGCHRIIDGVGFAFGNYDSAGRFRTEEFGQPIDATGNLFGTPVDGAVNFAEVAAAREEVRYCITRHLYTYATGRSGDDPRDLCQIQALADEFASGGELRGLARMMTLSNSFRYFIDESETDR